jgi:translation initiation factor IF-2
LIEAILLVAEEIEPRANPDAFPTGTVLEARMEKGRGVMTNLLVQNGTLRRGDTHLIGEHYGRIRSMFDYKGNRIDSAGPATPTSVSGLDGIPEAGDQFEVVESEKAARRIIEEEITAAFTGEERRAPVSLDEFFSRLQEGDTKSLNLIIKADVQGSLEPIVNSLKKLKNEEVTIDILRSATGNISESDVMLAAASDAVVLGFNVDVDSAARVAASTEQIEINTYSIIYKLIEDIEKAMKGMLAPVFEDVIIGRAEVRQVFRIRSAGAVAGSFMRTGEARRNAKCRVIRGANLLFSGEVSSLKHLQENVRDVKSGFEFGVSLNGFNDFREGDILEFFVNKRVER